MSDFQKDIQKKHYDKIAQEYTTRIDETSYNYYFAFTKQAIFSALKKHFKDLSSCTGIDIGCGNGDLTVAIKEKCLEMTGTDLSEGMISSAKKKHKTKKIRFLEAPSEKMSVKNSEFDFSVATHLFHHLAEKKLIENTIKEMKRVTKNKGIIIIVDVNKMNPASFFIQYLMVKRGVDTGKEKLVWPRTILNIFKKNNIKKIKYAGFCFVPHIFPKFNKYDSLIAKTFMNKFIGKDYIIVGEVIKNERNR